MVSTGLHTRLGRESLGHFSENQSDLIAVDHSRLSMVEAFRQCAYKLSQCTKGCHKFNHIYLLIHDMVLPSGYLAWFKLGTSI